MRVYTKLTPAPGLHFTHQSNRGRKRAEQSHYLINFDKAKSVAWPTRFAIIMMNAKSSNVTECRISGRVKENLGAGSEKCRADGISVFHHLHYRFPPPPNHTHTLLNKGVAPAFEISQTRSVTQFLKFFRKQEGRPHLGAMCTAIWGWWSGALQTNREKVREKRVCTCSRHCMNSDASLDFSRREAQ